MFAHIFNPKKRTASRELEIALHYLLHDAEKLIPLLKRKYKGEWPGFIDDIVDGARPYEEATVLLSIFLQQSFRDQDQAKRDTVIAAIAENNLVDPPNLLRIIGQVSYFLYLAEKDDGDVRENLWTAWLNDMSKVLIEAGALTQDQCITYLVTLSNQYRDAKLKTLQAEPIA